MFLGKTYLGIVDYYSKFPKICLLEEKTDSTVITHLKSLFACNSIPDELISDNIPFAGQELQKFAKAWGFRIVTSGH